MAKMSIYISDELKMRMDSANENWSGIAQRAFELQLNSTLKGGNDMSAVIERLRASKAKIEEVERPTWVAKGHAWASDKAEYEELKRIAALDMSGYDEHNDRKGDFRRRAFVEAYFDTDEVGPEHYEHLSYLLDQGMVSVPSGRQIGWFVEGAQAVWYLVSKEL